MTFNMFFSRTDVEDILQAISTSQKLLPRDRAFIRSSSGTHVFSQQHVKNKLKDLINNVDGRITSAEAAKQIDVDQKILLLNLPDDEDGWGVFALQIIPRKEFLRIWNILRVQLSDSLVQVWKFCKQNDINNDIFNKLLRYTPHGGQEPLRWNWEGTDQTQVYEQGFYEKKGTELTTVLDSLERPSELKSLAEESDLPEAFLTRIVTNLAKEAKVQGTIQGGAFTPERYMVTRQREILDRFVDQGVIGAKEMRRVGIEKPDEFVKQQSIEARLLKTSLVTEDYMKRMFDNARRLLDQEGFCEMTDSSSCLTSEEEAQLRKIFRSEFSGKLLEYDDHLVSPALVQKLSHTVTSFVSNQADTVLQSQVSKAQQSIDKYFNWNELHQFLSSAHPLVPARVISAITKSIHSKVVSSYTKELESLCKAHNAAVKHQFIDKVLSRFEVYRSGIINLPDRDLAGKLGGELLEYFKGQLRDGLEQLRKGMVDNATSSQVVQETKASVNDVFEDPTTKSEAKLTRISEILTKMMQDIEVQWATVEYVDSKKSEMVLELKKQAEKTTDNSLLLLVTIILLHSRAPGKNGGIIRASGKYVPKLLKLLKGKVDDDVFSLLKKVKDSIVGKAKLTSDDIESVRRITATY